MACDYCGLPVAGGRPAREGEPVYCCYGCRFAAQITRARGEQGHAAWMITRLGLSVFCTMGVMVFSLALYSRDVYSRGATDIHLGEAWVDLLRYVLLILATPVFLLLGLPILETAWAQVRRGTPALDALVVLGVAGAYASSYIATLRGEGDVYYETACMILVLITLGRSLEASAKIRAGQAVRELEALCPDEVEVRRDGRTLRVPARQVRRGDRMRVGPGRRIPADGRIIRGRSLVDERIVTGESLPVERNVGDVVHAGSLNVDGILTVEADAPGTHSLLFRLSDLLAEARRSRGRYERIADRAARLLTPVVIVLAGAGAVLGFLRGGGDEALMTALSVLLIACPCALGIATPLAVWIGLGTAARRGLLFRTAETMERLARVRVVALDKTGT
ncbi:MAG: cation-translocating P-type ATPase, partial [Planctomycetota bacterium]